MHVSLLLLIHTCNKDIMMKIFKQAEQKKQEADSKKRGNNASLKSTVSIPYFKGLYRKGDAYTIKCKQNKKKIDVVVKPLTGSFIISYATCLAQCIVNAENDKRRFSNDIEDCLAPVTLSSYLIEVVLSSEGFSLDDYAQGKTQGARRIEQHCKAIAEQRELSITVQDSIIQGVTPEIVNAVLSAI